MRSRASTGSTTLTTLRGHRPAAGRRGPAAGQAPGRRSGATGPVARSLRAVDDHIHSHAGSYKSHLVLALVLIAGFMVAEVIAGAAAGSLALLADAGHMLADVGAIAAALWAWHLADRPAQGSWTFGFKRAEILSAAGNGVLLLVVAAVVAVVAIRRLIHPPAVHGLTVVVIAAAGIIVNLAAARVLARGHRDSLNVEGAFQHILTDLYGFIATLIAGLVILIAGFSRADPLASLVVVALMLRAVVAAPEGLGARPAGSGPRSGRPGRRPVPPARGGPCPGRTRPARLDRHL